MVEALDDTNDVAHAEELRLQGNTAFASKKWKEAIDTYEESLSFDGDSKNSGIVCFVCVLCMCVYDVYIYLLLHLMYMYLISFIYPTILLLV